MKETEDLTSFRIMTIGHSTRTLEDFIRILQAYEVQEIVDIRTIPRSRRNPQFNRETLPDSLIATGIEYTHMSGLGGLRRPRTESVNAGWREPAFRGFADYMQTQEFEANVRQLVDMTREKRMALMCAEAVPWRCHRWLISDALLVRGIPVEHILSLTRSQPHSMTKWAKVNGTWITYPSQKSSSTAPQ